MRYPEFTGSSLFALGLAFFETSARRANGLGIPGICPSIPETSNRILDESKIRAIIPEGSPMVKLNVEPAL